MTTPTEREALIAALRTLRPSPAECDLVADLLEADAQEIKHLKSTALLDGIAYSMRVAERDKARTDAQQVAVPWDIEESVLAIYRIFKSAASFSTRDGALRSELKSVFQAGKAQQVAAPTHHLEKLLRQVIYGDFTGDNPDDLSLALAARQEFAVLKAAPQPPQAGINPLWLATHPNMLTQPPQHALVPMTEQQRGEGWINWMIPGYTANSYHCAFMAGIDYAEKHHGIGAKP